MELEPDICDALRKYEEVTGEFATAKKTQSEEDLVELSVKLCDRRVALWFAAVKNGCNYNLVDIGSIVSQMQLDKASAEILIEFMNHALIPLFEKIAFVCTMKTDDEIVLPMQAKVQEMVCQHINGEPSLISALVDSASNTYFNLYSLAPAPQRGLLADFYLARKKGDHLLHVPRYFMRELYRPRAAWALLIDMYRVNSETPLNMCIVGSTAVYLHLLIYQSNV